MKATKKDLMEMRLSIVNYIDDYTNARGEKSLGLLHGLDRMALELQCAHLISWEQYKSIEELIKRKKHQYFKHLST